MGKKESKVKPATPKERDDYSAVQTFMRRANHDARLMAGFLAEWLDRDLSAGLVKKPPGGEPSGPRATPPLNARLVKTFGDPKVIDKNRGDKRANNNRSRKRIHRDRNRDDHNGDDQR
jgi:hypothetical protein